jgi:hypothetical protein
VAKTTKETGLASGQPQSALQHKGGENGFARISRTQESSNRERQQKLFHSHCGRENCRAVRSAIGVAHDSEDRGQKHSKNPPSKAFHLIENRSRRSRKRLPRLFRFMNQIQSMITKANVHPSQDRRIRPSKPPDGIN